MFLAIIVLDGFLRGQPTNLGSRPQPQPVQSKPCRPHGPSRFEVAMIFLAASLSWVVASISTSGTHSFGGPLSATYSPCRLAAALCTNIKTRRSAESAPTCSRLMVTLLDLHGQPGPAGILSDVSSTLGASSFPGTGLRCTQVNGPAQGCLYSIIKEHSRCLLPQHFRAHIPRAPVEFPPVS